VLVLGLAALAGVVEPLTVPPGAEPGASGLGQLLWIVAPLGVTLLLRILGGDGKVYSLNMNAFGANVWLSHAIVGIVWGAWHLPFVFVFWPYLTPNMLWYFVPLLLVGTFSQSVVYGEIRLATGSVLPAWVMHTIGNAIGNTLLLSGFIQLGSGRELVFSPGVESVISIILMFAVGYWLHRRRKNVEQFGR
jgi:hypothetical protein